MVEVVEGGLWVGKRGQVLEIEERANDRLAKPTLKYHFQTTFLSLPGNKSTAA